MPEHFLVLGEALVDVVISRDGAVAESVGGSPANLAVALARLGNSVELAAGVGSDRLGRLVVDHLRSAGVRMAVDPHVLPRTSTAVATIDETGVASYQFEISGALPTPRVDRSVRHVTRAAAGATCFTPHHVVDVPAAPVVVADSIAAGDSFCAGVLDGLARAGCLGAEGLPRLRSASVELWRDVLLRAATASAITVSRPGADPPTLDELSAALGAAALVPRGSPGP